MWTSSRNLAGLLSRIADRYVKLSERPIRGIWPSAFTNVYFQVRGRFVEQTENRRSARWSFVRLVYLCLYNTARYSVPIYSKSFSVTYMYILYLHIRVDRMSLCFVHNKNNSLSSTKLVSNDLIQINTSEIVNDARCWNPVPNPRVARKCSKIVLDTFTHRDIFGATANVQCVINFADVAFYAFSLISLRRYFQVLLQQFKHV